jgi:hypothetical protein
LAQPGSFIDDTPTARLVRQVLGAISEFDKAMTVDSQASDKESSPGQPGGLSRDRWGCIRLPLFHVGR